MGSAYRLEREIGGGGMSRVFEATETTLGRRVVGTPAYMSPEQCAGDARVDHRTDVYALGMLGYEMLAGRNPFAGRTAQATFAAHMAEVPTPIELSRPSSPPALARLISRCLAKSAADRPQTADEVVNLLDAMVTPGGSPAHGAALSAALLPVVRPWRRPVFVAGAAGLQRIAAEGKHQCRLASFPESPRAQGVPAIRSAPAAGTLGCLTAFSGWAESRVRGGVADGRRSETDTGAGA